MKTPTLSCLASHMWDTLISGSSKLVDQLYTGDLAPMQAIGVVGVLPK